MGLTEIVDQWNKNALAGNYEPNVQRYLEGALRIGPEGTLEGKTAIRADFKDFHKKNNLTECNNRVEDIKIAGDLAVVIGSFAGRYISKENGESTDMNGPWIAVYERQMDGSWKMSYSIYTEIAD